MSVAETEVRAILDGHAKAISAKDVEGSLAHYAVDVVAFDLLDPLQHVGRDALRRRLEEWFSSFRGPIRFHMHDLHVHAGESVAVCHSLNHVIGAKTDGANIDMFWRTTLGLTRTDGVWTVVHSHASVPFSMTTGKASLGLKP